MGEFSKVMRTLHYVPLCLEEALTEKVFCCLNMHKTYKLLLKHLRCIQLVFVNLIDSIYTVLYKTLLNAFIISALNVERLT